MTPHVIGHPRVAHVVFVGPYGVGKTTAVRTLSDIRPITTDVFSTPMSQAPGGKATTTVGLDYGEWTAPDGQRVVIIGTPGQKRFTVMRRSVLAAGSGVVLWLFGNRRTAAEELDDWLTRIGRETSLAHVAVALTRTDAPDAERPDIEEYRAVLAARPEPIQVFHADPRHREGTLPVVRRAAELAARVPDVPGFARAGAR